MTISATGKRRFNQLICTDPATLSGFSWNQLKPRKFKQSAYFLNRPRTDRMELVALAMCFSSWLVASFSGWTSLVFLNRLQVSIPEVSSRKTTFTLSWNASSARLYERANTMSNVSWGIKPDRGLRSVVGCGVTFGMDRAFSDTQKQIVGDLLIKHI